MSPPWIASPVAYRKTPGAPPWRQLAAPKSPFDDDDDEDGDSWSKGGDDDDDDENEADDEEDACPRRHSARARAFAMPMCYSRGLRWSCEMASKAALPQKHQQRQPFIRF